VSAHTDKSNVKEQYGVIYRDGIQIIEWVDYNKSAENRKDMERPAVEVTFDINGYNITFYNIHTDPDMVPEEMDALEALVKEKGNTGILGDLNADCATYNNKKENQFDSWNWVPKDGEDTTWAEGTTCAYDRIILNNDANEEFVTYGVFKEGITFDISDHFLVWMKIIAAEKQ
jgi:endonuclease/exonuclease/phosphatase family metal-dependent hydrolase